ncbi:MAG: hypothetical protein HGA80_09080, partial [Candidatus Omnitrophica bacterium]|nr:hypothetical protein [Candidatus Omnitrophota bacterium]
GYDPNWSYVLTQDDIDAKADRIAAQKKIDLGLGPDEEYTVQLSDLYDQAYDPAYVYVLSTEESERFAAGNWSSAEELVNAKNIDTILEDGGSKHLIEAPNVIGNNVTLIAGAGIGQDLASEEIMKDAVLTPTQRQLIANARQSDIKELADKIIIARRDDFDVQASGKVNAYAQDHIYLGSEKGVNIEAVHSTAGDVQLKVQGDILNARGANDLPNIIAGSLVIDSANGAIGQSGSPVVTDLRQGGLLTAGAFGGIFIKELDGDLAADSVNSLTGAVDMEVSSGSLDIDTIRALSKTNLAARNIRVGQITQQPEGSEPFRLKASGPGESYAERISLRVDAGNPVIFDLLKARVADVDANVAKVSFLKTIIGDRAKLNNNVYTVIVDNVNKELFDCAAQLYAKDSPFYLEFSSINKPLTDALVLHYNGYDYLVNRYSTENSATRRIDKLLFTSGNSRINLAGESLQKAQTVNLFWVPLQYHPLSEEDMYIYDNVDRDLQEYYQSQEEEKVGESATDNRISENKSLNTSDISGERT